MRYTVFTNTKKNFFFYKLVKVFLYFILRFEFLKINDKRGSVSRVLWVGILMHAV